MIVTKVFDGTNVVFEDTTTTKTTSVTTFTIKLPAVTENTEFRVVSTVTSGEFEYASIEAIILGTFDNSITITRQPVSASMEQGGSYSFYCEAESALPLSYQWYTRMKGETIWNKIDRATDIMLTGVVAITDLVGSVKEFECVVTNGRRTVNSEIVELTVIEAPITVSIVSIPSSIPVVTSFYCYVSVTGNVPTDSLLNLLVYSDDNQIVDQFSKPANKGATTYSFVNIALSVRGNLQIEPVLFQKDGKTVIARGERKEIIVTG